MAAGLPAWVAPLVKGVVAADLRRPDDLFIASVGAERVRENSTVLPPFSWARAFCDHCLTGATLTSPSIRGYGEALQAGAVVSSHCIVADLGAGTPRCTFIFI